ncbi:MAG: DUF4264 family protein [Betaproteobacteria bacterium]
MSHEESVPASSTTAKREEARLDVLGQATVAVCGDTHRLVTFLNQTLKDQNLIFGLTKAPDGQATFTVYRLRAGNERPTLKEE